MRRAHTPYITVAPGDSPPLYSGLAQRLHDAARASGAPIAAAHDGERLQPVFALLACELLDDLVGYLNDGE